MASGMFCLAVLGAVMEVEGLGERVSSSFKSLKEICVCVSLYGLCVYVWLCESITTDSVCFWEFKGNGPLKWCVPAQACFLHKHPCIRTRALMVLHSLRAVLCVCVCVTSICLFICLSDYSMYLDHVLCRTLYCMLIWFSSYMNPWTEIYNLSSWWVIFIVDKCKFSHSRQMSAIVGRAATVLSDSCSIKEKDSQQSWIIYLIILDLLELTSRTKYVHV